MKKSISFTEFYLSAWLIVFLFLTGNSAAGDAVLEPGTLLTESDNITAVIPGTVPPIDSCPFWFTAHERTATYEKKGGDIIINLNACKFVNYEVVQMPQKAMTWPIEVNPGDFIVVWDEDKNHGAAFEEKGFELYNPYDQYGNNQDSKLVFGIDYILENDDSDYIIVDSNSPGVNWAVYRILTGCTMTRQSDKNEHDVIRFLNDNVMEFNKDDNLSDGDCAIPGQEIIYNICWNNIGGPNAVNPAFDNVVIVDYLPEQVKFDYIVSLEPLIIDSNYDSNSHAYRFDIGDINPAEIDCVSLPVTIKNNAQPGIAIKNTAYMFSGGKAIARTEKFTDICCDWGTGEAGIIYVDQLAKGYNSGTGWQNAYTDLQSALYRAKESSCNPAGGFTVYVARGTYKTAGYEALSFELPANIKVYGGFKNGGSAFEERNPDLYKTVLNGCVGERIDGDGDIHIIYNNSIVVMGENSLLDGFTVQEAKIQCIDASNVSSMIENCVIENSKEHGVYCKNGNLAVKWSEIKNNTFNGIWHTGERYILQIENTVISENLWRGLLTNDSILTIKNSVIANNGFFNIIDKFQGIEITSPAENPVLYGNSIVKNAKEGILISIDDPNSTVSADIQNCIVYYNFDNTKQIKSDKPSKVFYCCIYDANDVDGSNHTPDVNGNFTGKPGFAYNDPNQYDNPDIPFNYHLAFDSPCIDKGSTSLDYTGQNDIDGEQRAIVRADIGADEVYSCDGNLSADDIYNPLDWNADGIINYDEAVYWSRSWLTHDPCDPALTDSNEPGYYDFTDAERTKYLSQENRDRWNGKCNLADTGGSMYSIDMEDLMSFCSDGYWLWIACWKESRINRFKTAPALPAGAESMVMSSSPAAEPEQSATSVQGIIEIMDFVDTAIAENPPNTQALYDLRVFLEDILKDLQ